MNRRNPHPALFPSLLVVILCLLPGCAAPPTADVVEEGWALAGTADTVASTEGVVVSGHPLASQVGADVLAAGGNAADAAVAVGLALAVVLPEAGNLGGGGFLVHRAAAGEVHTLDYRERAPQGASRDMYLDASGEPTKKSTIGHLAAGVPGSVAGLWEMHQQLGTMPWADLVEPAIQLARSHRVDEVRARHLESAAERLATFPASAETFLPGGSPPAPGDEWSQPALASTLEMIRDHGADAFYRGPIADLLVAEMEQGGGIITHQDLADYRPVWREPIVAEYRGYTLYSMPPPSSGGVTVALMLNVLEGFEPLPPFGSEDLVHLEAETMRRAFLERNRYLGDPDFVELPVARLQSQEFADELRRSIDLARATPTPPFAAPATEGTETTHYSIVDRAGNAASVTTTINSSFGSAVTVAGAGFLLNNEMDDFAAAPGKPNQFGLVEGEANAIAPGKRMLSSMTPSVVLDRDGRLLLVVGSPGGPTIITTVLQVISNVLDHEMTLSGAVESPRVHHQALPDVLFYERGGLDAGTVTALTSRGHTLRQREGHSGDVSAVVRDGEGFVGVADPRRGGGAAAPRARVSSSP